MYEQQLCTYAHILERRHGQRVERLVLYWTAEEKKSNAIMEFPYRPEMVASPVVPTTQGKSRSIAASLFSERQQGRIRQHRFQCVDDLLQINLCISFEAEAFGDAGLIRAQP